MQLQKPPQAAAATSSQFLRRPLVPPPVTGGEGYASLTSLQIFVDELLDGNTSRRFRRLRRSLKRIWQMQRQSIRDVIDLLPIAYKPC
jgi:hypothetical protein